MVHKKAPAYDRIVHVTVGKTNHNSCDLVDRARRQLDQLGRVGIAAKLGETNEVFMSRGYLRFVFPNTAMRQRFIDRVEEHCPPAVKVRLFKRRRQVARPTHTRRRPKS